MASRKWELRHSTWNTNSELSAIIIGRTLRLCGATAVSENTLVPGTIIGPPLDKEYAVLPVGDGANDLPMISEAGLGIAFHAKPRVVANAKQSINTIGLDGVLYFLGFKDSYID